MEEATLNPAGTAYRCRRCGNCCRWPGVVRLTPEDLSAIARGLRMTLRDFTGQYTRLLPDRSGLALTECSDGSCIFLQGNDCLIHDFKPRQCRAFPDLWNFDGFERLCQATRLSTPAQSEADNRL